MSDRSGANAYDLVVIGSGPAGEKAATHAAYFGRRVAVVERASRVGGVVVNSGGVLTKTLRETALAVSGFRTREVYGVTLQLDRGGSLSVLRERAERVMVVMEGRVRENLHRHGVELIRGEASLAGPGRVRVITGAGEREIAASAILVATGSRPLRPSGFPFEDPGVLDSDDLMAGVGDIDDLVVVGGGVIGCEYASILRALGVTVTLVDVAPRLIPMFDVELSTLLAARFHDLGMRLRLGVRVGSVERAGEQLMVTLSDGERLPADRILVAVGRAGNTQGLGLEAAGVELTERGHILVDADQRATAPGVFAAGDVTGPPALASVAIEQGRRAASSALGTPLHEADALSAPMAAYTVPEVGQFGMTEEEARAAGVPCVVGRARFAANTRATIAGSTEGLVKLVCDTSGRILGVQILGDIAADLVHIGQALVQHAGRVDYLLHSAFNVPTWSEAYQYAAFDALGQLEGRYRAGAGPTSAR